MKHAPNLWEFLDLHQYMDEGPRAQIKDGLWIPARPLGLFSLRNRIKLAWNVFLGRYDALKWPK